MTEEFKAEEINADKNTAGAQAVAIAEEIAISQDAKALIKSKIFWTQVISLGISAAAFFGLEDKYVSLIPVIVAPVATIVFRYVNNDISGFWK